MSAFKTLAALLGVSLSSSLGAQTGPAALTDDSQARDSYRITERGPHHRGWSSISEAPDRSGGFASQTNSYVELTTGLHYRDPASGEWRESDPGFELTADGYAVARRCQHQVVVTPSLNPEDGVVIDLRTPDGQRLRSGILGLNLFDPVSGNSLQIAAVRDVAGTLVSSNEIVWFDAFEGLRGDVRVRNERGEFHQDVLLREKLSAEQLAALGVDAGTVRLEVWTEFIEAPEPVSRRIVLRTETNATLRATMADPDEADQVLKFGREMLIGRGSVFIEDEPTKTTRVFKQWQRTGDRRFLIEAVKYAELLPLLAVLPVKTAALKPERAASGLAANRLPPERATLPKPTGGKTARLAQLDPAASLAPPPRVVLDYVMLTSQPNLTLAGDTTYYVSGTVNLSGTTVLEGGTVVKSSVSQGDGLVIGDWDGVVVCKTGPYRPAIFTSRNDNSVGSVIAGSTGNPGSADVAAAFAIRFEWSDVELHDLRVSYATTGLRLEGAGGAQGSYRLTDAQIVHCSTGIVLGLENYPSSGTSLYLGNVLFYEVQDQVIHAWDTDCQIIAEHVTAFNPAADGVLFAGETGSNFDFVLRNSLLSGLSGLGAPVNRIATPASVPANTFQTVGAGACYLANDTYRNAGTPLINPDLALALKTKTTYPPTVVSGPVTTPTTWSPLATRDTDTPDLGYHYEPLDWVANARNVSAALTLNGGVAVGTYGAAASHGLGITSTGSLDSQGGPVNLNWIVRYNTVQEQSASPWASGTVGSTVKILSGTPTVTASFTGWSVPAVSSWGDHFDNRNGGTATFTHCQFSGGKFTIDPGSVDLINCLWQRVYVTLRDMDGDPDWNLYNNLFYGGTLYYRATGDHPTLVAKDNCFDRTTITRGASSESFTHDYNGYLTGQDRLTPSPGPNDVVLANLVYAPGPRGNFYQAQTDLLNQGSRSAADAGLDYYYTVVPDQTRDGSSGNGDPVDIGFHYYIGSAPTAFADYASPCRNQPVNITLSGYDPDNDLLKYIVLHGTGYGPNHGTLSPADGFSQHRTYTPNAGYEGPDSFTFKVNDGFFDSDPTTVTIEIGGSPWGDWPVEQTCRGQAKEITLTGSDGCDGGGTLAFSKVIDPAFGVLGAIIQVDPTHAKVTYTPNAGACGSDSFQYKVNDGWRDSFPATVTINVGDPNLAAQCQDVMVKKGEALTFTLTGYGNDVCGEQLTFAVVPGSGPAAGNVLSAITQVDARHATITYTPNTSFEGEDGFHFSVSGCGFPPSTAYVSIHVVPSPILTTDCREDCTILRWTVPDWVSQANVPTDFQIYRCDSASGSCNPSTLFATVGGNARAYQDTAVVPGRTYCYKVRFRHLQNASCGGSLIYESPFSNESCSQVCPPPPPPPCFIRPGFDSEYLARNDDNEGVNNLQATLPFGMNFYGTTHTRLFVNNNGNITFGSSLGSYTPLALDSLALDIIAPFWADVDTRSTTSDVVRYGSGIVGGRSAFGVEWTDVGYFAFHAEKLVSVQLVIIERSDTGAGNFDMEFNYCMVRWEAGDVSGGINGFWVGPNGSPARVGFASSTGQSFEFAGSGLPSVLLDTAPTSGLIYRSFNSSDAGRYVFQFRSGSPVATP